MHIAARVEPAATRPMWCWCCRAGRTRGRPAGRRPAARAGRRSRTPRRRDDTCRMPCSSSTPSDEAASAAPLAIDPRADNRYDCCRRRSAEPGGAARRGIQRVVKLNYARGVRTVVSDDRLRRRTPPPGMAWRAPAIGTEPRHLGRRPALPVADGRGPDAQAEAASSRSSRSASRSCSTRAVDGILADPDWWSSLAWPWPAIELARQEPPHPGGLASLYGRFDYLLDAAATGRSSSTTPTPRPVAARQRPRTGDRAPAPVAAAHSSRRCQTPRAARCCERIRAHPTTGPPGRHRLVAQLARGHGPGDLAGRLLRARAAGTGRRRERTWRRAPRSHHAARPADRRAVSLLSGRASVSPRDLRQPVRGVDRRPAADAQRLARLPGAVQGVPGLAVVEPRPPGRRRPARPSNATCRATLLARDPDAPDLAAATASSSTSTAAKAIRSSSAPRSTPPAGRRGCSKAATSSSARSIRRRVEDVEVDDLQRAGPLRRSALRVRRRLLDRRPVRRLLHPAGRADHVGAGDVRGDAVASRPDAPHVGGEPQQRRRAGRARPA